MDLPQSAKAAESPIFITAGAPRKRLSFGVLPPVAPVWSRRGEAGVEQFLAPVVCPGEVSMTERRNSRLVGIVVEAAIASTIIATAIYLFG
jgi:hypothetical protein